MVINPIHLLSKHIRVQTVVYLHMVFGLIQKQTTKTEVFGKQFDILLVGCIIKIYLDWVVMVIWSSWWLLSEFKADRCVMIIFEWNWLLELLYSGKGCLLYERPVFLVDHLFET